MTFGQNQIVLKPPSNSLSFKLPREYGAIVVFVLASIVALVLSQREFFAIACLQLCLWPLIFSAHRPQQLLQLTVLIAIVLYLCEGLPFAIWIAAVGIGIFAVSPSPSSSSSSSWLRLGALPRESIGLAGAALAPLVFSYLLAANRGLNLSLHMSAIFALLAATLTSSSMIYFCREQARKQKPAALVLLAVLSLLLWLCLSALSSHLAALSLLAYVFQSLWLLPVAQHSYKQLGQVQSFCLLWVSIATVLHILQIITE